MTAATPPKFSRIDSQKDRSGPRPSLPPSASARCEACSVVFARIAPTPALASPAPGSAGTLPGSAFWAVGWAAESCAKTLTEVLPINRQARNVIAAQRFRNRRLMLDRLLRELHQRVSAPYE